jgi:hypothetical protein
MIVVENISKGYGAQELFSQGGVQGAPCGGVGRIKENEGRIEAVCSRPESVSADYQER